MPFGSASDTVTFNVAELTMSDVFVKYFWKNDIRNENAFFNRD